MTEREHTQRRLEALRDVFARAAIGDFSKDVEMYEEEDEFTGVYVGVQIMLEVIRDQLTELKKLNAALEGKVEKLQEEITERSEMEERKDEFISVLGHELRNPLGAIMYAAELIVLKMDNAPGAATTDIRGDLGVVMRQGQHLTRLVNDMLDMSRIIRGQFTLERKLVDARDVIRHAIETAKPSIEERKHALRIDMPDVPVMLDVDPLRIEQTLVNILNNAAKYTPRKGAIVVHAENIGDEALIRISDTGVGIPQHLVEKMFDLFTRGRSSGTDSGGLGIGLTVARGIVRLHGGDVEARSEGLGRGTTINIRLPLAHAITAQTRGHSKSAMVSPSRRVLVVDDNADHAESLGSLLRAFGHEVQVAHGGTEGLSAALAFKPDAAFVDLAMPDMDGYEVAASLRTNPDFATTRLIAITGFGQDSDRERTKAAGFDRHLVKPASVDDMLAAIS